MLKDVKRYEEIEHTADFQVKVFGRDEQELFENAAFALLDNLVRLDDVEERTIHEVSAEGADREETLVNFLSQLLYDFEGEGRVYRVVTVVELSATKVRAAARGEAFDKSRHRTRTGIKAVTFHDVDVVAEGDAVAVTITFDV